MIHPDDAPLYRAARARAKRDSVEFPQFLANHAPMVMVAMRQMGASATRIAEWYDGYQAAHPLPPQPPSRGKLTAETWQTALGDRSRERDARAFFVAETERLGIDGALRFYVPQLTPYMAASAIHPLMRIAYALIDQDAEDIGHSLGYWVACALPVPMAKSDGAMTTNPADIVVGIPALSGVRDYDVEIDLLWHHIRAVTEMEGFPELAGSLRMTPEAPCQMAALSLALYAGTMDFCALHAVTGFHWLRLMRPHLDDPDALYPVLWAIIASLIPKIGFPALPSKEALDEIRRLPTPEWPEIFAKACAATDEHDISLTYSASQENQIWPDPLYRVVAARRLGMID